VIKLLASLPPIQSAIKLDGSGGARVQLDIPETCLDEVLKLAYLKEQILRVEIYDEYEGEE